MQKVRDNGASLVIGLAASSKVGIVCIARATIFQIEVAHALSQTKEIQKMKCLKNIFLTIM